MSEKDYIKDGIFSLLQEFERAKTQNTELIKVLEKIIEFTDKLPEILKSMDKFEIEQSYSLINKMATQVVKEFYNQKEKNNDNSYI